MRISSYLTVSRHHIFYLRYPLPPALHPLHRASDIKLSLETRCPKEALRLSRSLVTLAETFIKRAMAHGMDFAQIREVLITHFKGVLGKTKAQIEAEGPFDPRRIQITKSTIGDAEDSIGQADPFLGSDEDITRFIGRYNLPIENGTPAFEMLRTEYQRAMRDFCIQKVRLNESYETYDFSDLAPQDILASPQPKGLTVKLAAEADAYIAELIRLNKGETNKGIKEKRSHLNLLMDYLGKDAPLYISPEQASEVKNLLFNLPKHMSLKASLKGMSVAEIAALPNNHPDKENNLLDNASIFKYMSTYSTFYTWAVDKKAVAENNFKAINVTVDKFEQRRDAFSPEQIVQIMEAALKEENEAYKWCTLLGCYSGARLEEIAQLGIDNICEQNGIWYMDINERDGRELKNRSSTRIVPLHSRLIELGFLDYLKATKAAGHTRLFPQLKFTVSNRYGRNLSRWFNETLLPRLKIKTERLTFHSLRHTFTTRLQQADVEDSLIKRLIGHSQQDTLNIVYAKGQQLSQLRDAVEKI